MDVFSCIVREFNFVVWVSYGFFEGLVNWDNICLDGVEGGFIFYIMFIVISLFIFEFSVV